MGAIRPPESLTRREFLEGGTSGHSLSTCPHVECSSQDFFQMGPEVTRNW